MSFLEEIQDELFVRLKVLAEFRPHLGRPHVDTLNGSSFANMKELRFQKDGVAFCFCVRSAATRHCTGWRR
jgi:hypothetical protein